GDYCVTGCRYAQADRSADGAGHCGARRPETRPEMNLGLTGKSALVLAASKGLGRASAYALAAEGARVMIGSRRACQLGKTASDLREQTGADVRSVPVDVTDAAQCAAIF